MRKPTPSPASISPAIATASVGEVPIESRRANPPALMRPPERANGLYPKRLKRNPEAPAPPVGGGEARRRPGGAARAPPRKKEGGEGPRRKRPEEQDLGASPCVGRTAKHGCHQGGCQGHHQRACPHEVEGRRLTRGEAREVRPHRCDRGRPHREGHVEHPPPARAPAG